MKRFLIFAVMFTSAALCQAQAVDQTKAMQRASRYFNEHVRPAGLRSTAEAEPAAVTPWMAGDTTCMYAVQMDGGGWVLVSADDRTTASVLAYSENGTFDTEDMPDGMRWLLEKYGNEIRYVKDSLSSDVEISKIAYADEGLNAGGSAYYDPGNALLNTSKGEIQWGQSRVLNDDGSYCDRSYNYYCPEGEGGKCGKCPAGCGAVAMGQIMRYWQWPPCAEVPTSISGDGVIVSNKETHCYDWNEMPLQLRSTTQVDSARAVARLLKDLGYTAHTNYDYDGSSTLVLNLDAAFEKFKYHANRHDLITGDWGDEIRYEINQGRPVLYGGSSKDLKHGHWFVIDGYSETDSSMFHVNWGWGDQSKYNGSYYKLDNLSPENVSYSYSTLEQAITEIYPECSTFDFPLDMGSGTIDVGETVAVSFTTAISTNTFVSGKTIFQVDEMTLQPGFEVQQGAEVQILTPAYQYCNSYGPGKKN